VEIILFQTEASHVQLTKALRKRTSFGWSHKSTTVL